MDIAIQGGRASFHDIASRGYFANKSFETLFCDTFPQVCQALATGVVDRAVMAIENTLAGPIIDNHRLLQDYSFSIVGETYLAIDLYLMALPGQKISDIKRLYSHPVALNQIGKFLAEHPAIEKTKTFDTADSARDIREKGLQGVAAVAGRHAAETHGMEILASRIQDHHHNFTRFLFLARETPPKVQGNKASLFFTLMNPRDDLVRVRQLLCCFNPEDTSLVPIPGRSENDPVTFHLDVVFQNLILFKNFLEKLSQMSSTLNVLGIYQRGGEPHDHSDSQTT